MQSVSHLELIDVVKPSFQMIAVSFAEKCTRFCTRAYKGPIVCIIRVKNQRPIVKYSSDWLSISLFMLIIMAFYNSTLLLTKITCIILTFNLKSGAEQ
jgi:hypothetical protein